MHKYDFTETPNRTAKLLYTLEAHGLRVKEACIDVRARADGASKVLRCSRKASGPTLTSDTTVTSSCMIGSPWSYHVYCAELWIVNRSQAERNGGAVYSVTIELISRSCHTLARRCTREVYSCLAYLRLAPHASPVNEQQYRCV